MRSLSNWGRMVLALVIGLVVAGPALVLAVPPTSAYAKPVLVTIIGPDPVSRSGANVDYQARIQFDNSEVVIQDVDDAEGAFAAILGTFVSGGDLYDPPASGSRDRLTFTYTFNGVTRVGSRLITLTP